MKEKKYPLLTLLMILTISTTTTSNTALPCRSYCGNLTIDYPFATRSGCGNSGFRNLLFCVNDVLMLHLSSGSYRVLDIDYSFHSLTLHDPFMSTCSTIFRRRQTTTTSTSNPNGLILSPSLSPFLTPSSDNVFLLLGCSSQSPLFQGFPSKHLPCRNVSGMGCEAFFSCPAWHAHNAATGSDDGGGGGGGGGSGGSGPRCCAVSYEAIKEVNLTRLQCDGYSSAYSVAPVKVEGPSEWTYGIRMTYSVPGDYAFCRACEATRGTCGYDEVAATDLCLCGTWNSTSNCDSGWCLPN